MLTVAQQADNHIRILQGMMANAVPNNAGNIEHTCAAIVAVLNPAVRGGLFALPAPSNEPTAEQRAFNRGFNSYRMGAVEPALPFHSELLNYEFNRGWNDAKAYFER